MSLGIGPISHSMTRAMHALIESIVSWCDMLTLTDDVKYEMEFLLMGLRSFDTQPIWHSPSAVCMVYFDASDTGYGGYIVEHGPYVALGQ